MNRNRVDLFNCIPIVDENECPTRDSFSSITNPTRQFQNLGSIARATGAIKHKAIIVQSFIGFFDVSQHY